MLTGQTRLLLLTAGRCSIDLWLRAGRLSEPGLRSRTHASYDRMAEVAPWPDQHALRLHLALSVLPGAAVYTALREGGWSSKDAVDAVTRAMLAVSQVPNQAQRLLMLSDRGRRLFLRYLGPAVGAIFPAPGWRVTWVERSPQRIAFNITRCYTLDALRRLDAAPVATAYCAVDQAINASLSPRMRFSRTGTLAAGGSRCDFCFELVQPQRTPTQPGNGVRVQP